MGIIRELRQFMADMRTNDTAIKVLQGQIRRLERQNSQLHDRIMARNFEHFKEYEAPPRIDLNPPGYEYNVQNDETSAGMVLSDEIE